MGRQRESIEITVWCETAEHQQDAEFIDRLKWVVRKAVSEVQQDYPDYFIDTMGLE